MRFNCWMRRPNRHQQAHRHKSQPWIRHTTMPIQGGQSRQHEDQSHTQEKPTLTQPSNAGVDNPDSQHHKNSTTVPTQVVHDHVTLPNIRPSVNNAKLRWDGNNQLPRNTLHMLNTRIMNQMWIYGVGVLI